MELCTEGLLLVERDGIATLTRNVKPRLTDLGAHLLNCDECLAASSKITQAAAMERRPDGRSSASRAGKLYE